MLEVSLGFRDFRDNDTSVVIRRWELFVRGISRLFKCTDGRLNRDRAGRMNCFYRESSNNR
jgi:hypothetical protein